MLRLRVDSTSTVPPSRQLVEGVLDAIARGALEEGARLPSVRELAAEALVNPNTVAKAYRELQWLGAV
ncbi:MAG: GntR family transcriptional regulator, partial [Planctomycetes bacterium]|nr:GntR family transcriptional regulator [Planctomycetota bacterium]